MGGQIVALKPQLEGHVESLGVRTSRELLKLGANLVIKHYPTIRPYKDGWTYKTGRSQWEFHGPGNFYWHGRASNAYDARYKGWMAWLEKRGVDIDKDEATVSIAGL
jgi:hypothetical protein